MEWSEVLLSEDGKERTGNAIHAFQSEEGVGPVLQNRLMELSRDPHLTNWLEPYWSESYLSNPAPLPIGSNVTFILDKNPPVKALPLSEFLTSLIITLCEMNDLIVTESLDIDYQRKQPLCMSQYKTLFSTTRIPGETTDSHFTTPHSAHVIIIHRGHYYRLTVLDDKRNILSYDTVHRGILSILDSPRTNNQSAVGTLTTLPRRKWAHLRRHLIAIDPGNENNLHQIESALAVFIIDQNRYENDSQMFKHLFLGDHHNRWYDKSLQCILNEGGHFGINYEHSGVDGTTLGHLVSYLYQNMRTLEPSSEGIKKTLVDEITFTIDDLIESAIREAAIEIQEAFDNVIFEVMPFTDFGQEHIKTLGVSPDSFVQIGIQLAQHKTFQKVFNAYESVMTKQFLGGRTETMRPLTRESLAFVNDPTLEGLRAASLKHVERINECKNGQGIDRHLFGLKKIHEQLFPVEPLPEIFASPGYRAITTDYFSTSTSSSVGMRYAGYGPSVNDGFAVRYLIFKDRLHFVLSCHKHRADLLMPLKNSLEQALREMGRMGSGISR